MPIANDYNLKMCIEIGTTLSMPQRVNSKLQYKHIGETKLGPVSI